jgi:hypothetical protein
LVFSFDLGGKGANKIAKAVAGGTWKTDTSTPSFDWQAKLTMLGLVLLLIAGVVGSLESRMPTKDPCVSGKILKGWRAPTAPLACSMRNARTDVSRIETPR